MIILSIHYLLAYKLDIKLQAIIIKLKENIKAMSTINSQNTSVEAIRANRLRMKQEIKNSWSKPTLNSQLFQQIDPIFSEHLEQRNKQPVDTTNFNTKRLGAYDSPKEAIKENEKFEDIYILKEKLGEGAQAVVYRCESKLTGESFAVKITRTRSPQVIQTIQDSFLLLKNLEHENIIKAHRLFVDEESSICHVVLQLCEYRDLRDSIEKQIFSSYTQNQILAVVKRILNAVDYLQQKGICHRDIKPENILYNPESGQLKLVDFELAKLKKIDEEKLQMWTNTGSLHYRAPQSFEGVYDGKVDIWAAGIVAYELFSGEVPFKSSNHNQNIEMIVKEQINYEFLAVTYSVKCFLKRLLEKIPEKRATSQQMLELEIFQQKMLMNSTPSLCSTVNEDQEFSPYLSHESFLQRMNTQQELLIVE